MKKWFNTVLSSLAVCALSLGLVATPVQAAQTQEISKIVAFGDSYSDNGSANAVSKAILETGHKDAFIKPGEVYWQNRYSNGKTGVEVLAEMADKPLKNYATGGATSGYENYSAWMDSLGNTGCLGQIDKYAKDLNTQDAMPNTLHFIFVSANDYFRFFDFAMEGKVEDVADQAVQNIKTGIEKLADLGAKKFFVVGSSDLSLVPYEIGENRTLETTIFTNRMNAALPWMLAQVEKELGLDITFFDVTKVSDQIVANPDKYGIINFTQAAQPTWPEVLPAASNVDQYYFWDEWHFSRVIHRTFGEAFYEVYKTIK